MTDEFDAAGSLGEDPFDSALPAPPSEPVWTPMDNRGVILGRARDGSAEWHRLRAGGLGGSEISAVMGRNPWDSPYSLFHKKLSGVVEEKTDPILEWGHRLEPAVALKLEEELNAEYGLVTGHSDIRRIAVVNDGGTYRHSELGWKFANADRFLKLLPILGESGRLICPIELKTALYPDGWGPSMSDGIPEYYRMQLNHYIDVHGAAGGWLAVLIGGWDFRKYWVPRDQGLIDEMTRAGTQFMNWLDEGILPEIDGHTETLKVVRAEHPDIEDREVEIPEQLSVDWHKAKRAVDEAEAWERENKAKIMALLGKAKRGTVNGVRHVMRSPTAGGGAPHLRSSLPKKRKNL